MGIVRETIPNWFLVFYVRFSGISMNGSGVHPRTWDPIENILFKQSTRIAGVFFAEILGQFFGDSALNLVKDLRSIFLASFRMRRVSRPAVSLIFVLCFSCNRRQVSFASQCSHPLMRKVRAVVKVEEYFCVFDELEGTTRSHSSNKQLLTNTDIELTYKSDNDILQ